MKFVINVTCLHSKEIEAPSYEKAVEIMFNQSAEEWADCCYEANLDDEDEET